jgi:hypothetical protein
MRSLRSFVSPLATAGLVAVATSSAAAQTVAAHATAHSVAATSVPVAPRIVALYHFATTGGGMPSEVTLADSAGVLVANYRLWGANRAEPMMVDFVNTDLVLQGQTPSGVLTLLLNQQPVPETGSIVIGRWMLENRQGELRARASH